MTDLNLLPSRSTSISLVWLLALPLALQGCSQPAPPGSDDGGSESSAGDTTTDTATTASDMSGGESGTDTGEVGESLCPLGDGAQWNYVVKSTAGQVLGMDNTSTTETTWNGMQAWELVDEPNANGVWSSSTLIDNGTEILRVHREDMDQSGTIEIVDYEPGFVRCSDAWTTVGLKEEFLYDRTAYDGNGLNPMVEGRGHTFEVLAVNEQVTVPAGTFDCVKVERVRTVGTEAGALVWFWFAPGVGKVREEDPVAMEVEELASVSIPGGVSLP